jgi:hypothetical protein
MTVGIAPLRPFTGWVRNSNPSKKETQFLFSSIDFDVDLWNILEYYSEVSDVGLAFISSKNLSTQLSSNEIFDKFRAFIRQSKANYDAAKVLPYRSSGLLYYYCFLNLAKAFILLRDPDKVMGRVTHGLSYNPSSVNILFDEEIITTSSGVFSTLYKIETGIDLQIMSDINIADILGLCSDILYQYLSGGFGTQKLYPGISCIAADSNSKSSWLLWGILEGSDIENRMPDVHSRVLDVYEKTSIDNNIANKVFKHYRREWLGYKFYQSRSVVPWEPGDKFKTSVSYHELIDTLYPHYSEHYFKDDFDFDITLRTDVGNIPMNEMLSIYAVMFYLSSLVRYRPDYLERILSDKASWIISSFVNSCILEFLKQMCSRIVDKVIVLSRR